MQKVKDQAGKEIQIDAETFPADFLHAIVDHDPIDKPDKKL